MGKTSFSFARIITEPGKALGRDARRDPAAAGLRDGAGEGGRKWEKMLSLTRKRLDFAPFHVQKTCNSGLNRPQMKGETEMDVTAKHEFITEDNFCTMRESEVSLAFRRQLLEEARWIAP
jgi:hypothetical protein